MEIKPILSKYKVLDDLIPSLLNAFWRFVRFVYSSNGGNQGKILIIALHKIGDSVFTIPAITNILDHFMSKNVYLVTYTDTKIIFKDVVEAKNIHAINKEEFLYGNRLATSAARKIIKNIQPDLIIDLTGSITSATLIFNSKAKKIVGMNDKYFKNIYDDFVEIRSKPHLVQRYFDVTKILLRENNVRNSFEFPISYSNVGIILIHPFAGWKAKEWGLNNYILLASKLQKDYNTSLIFQKGEIKEDVINHLTENNINFIQTDSLVGLIAEIEKCSLFISNDSGPLYLANKYGKPTFTIYGPTNPEYSKPFGNFHKQIRKILDCSPTITQYCYLEAGRNCPSNECMYLLNADLVLAEILEFILSLNISNNHN